MTARSGRPGPRLAAGPVALVVLDGWGLRDEEEHNAVARARTPVFDGLWRRYPRARLKAHGEHVGLGPGQIGNSNVGHLNLGAGRIVRQPLVIIDDAIADGSFARSEILSGAMERAKARGRPVHLMGLFSDGGVHSHINHLLALARMADARGVKPYFHCFLDGRDVPPRSAARYFRLLAEARGARGLREVATVMGRYYAMDRDRRWDRIEAAYDALVRGRGRTASDPLEALDHAYGAGESDEFVSPTVIVGEAGAPRGPVAPGDEVIFFNFRADRARQLAGALAAETFGEFHRNGAGAPAVLTAMMPYDEQLPVPAAFRPEELRNTLGEWAARHGLTQLRIAETEKYAHVTYFFNGGAEAPFQGEQRILVPSPRVATYDLQPEMSAGEVTRRLQQAVAGADLDLIVLNYANPDMVGHTGIMPAAVAACEAVDEGLGETVEAVLAREGAVVIVADHGNAEIMLDAETGQPHTAHTTSPVPIIIVKNGWERDRSGAPAVRDGILADVAPTMLHILGLPRPPEMDRESLLAFK